MVLLILMRVQPHQIEDSNSILSRLITAFEAASIEEDEEKKAQMLQFVAVGAGPTGVEFAAELEDHIQEDLIKLYPNEVKLAKVVLVSSSDDLLSSYDKRVSDFTMELLSQTKVDLKTGVRVTEVTENSVVCKYKATGEVFEVPSALTLWSTGVGPVPLVEKLIEAVPEQTKSNALFVDSSCRAYGMDGVYAIGDCASVYAENTMNAELDELFLTADADGSGTLDKKEILDLFSKVSDKYPQAAVFQTKIDEDYEKYDVDNSGELDLEEFDAVLMDFDSSLRSLPPTAQVAGQQGGYLAAQFNGENGQSFKYFHKGSMAYLGQDKAAAQVSMLKNLLPKPLQNIPILGEDIVLTGALAELVWKFLYVDMQVSNRNKVQVIFDWVKTGIFGRDTSKY